MAETETTAQTAAQTAADGKPPLRVAVVDGQGGGVGRALVERLRALYGGRVFITALGTNSAATSAMLRSGADQAATGENAIVVNARCADVVTGPIGILAAGSMLGELTPKMAAAIGESPAVKALVPVRRCNLRVAGVADCPFAELVDAAARLAGEGLEGHGGSGTE